MTVDSPNGEHCAQCWAIISAVDGAHRDVNRDWNTMDAPRTRSDGTDHNQQDNSQRDRQGTRNHYG